MTEPMRLLDRNLFVQLDAVAGTIETNPRHQSAYQQKTAAVGLGAVLTGAWIGNRSRVEPGAIIIDDGPESAWSHEPPEPHLFGGIITIAMFDSVDQRFVQGCAHLELIGPAKAMLFK